MRKQFGPDRNGTEVPIIDYQLHQWRIFPYLAAAAVFKVSVFALTDIYLETVEKSQADSNGFELLVSLVGTLCENLLFYLFCFIIYFVLF